MSPKKQTPFKLVYGQKAIVPVEFMLQALRLSIQYQLDLEATLQDRLQEPKKLNEQWQKAL